jgi:hypothetical protein
MPVFWQGLRDAGSEMRANVAERRVDTRSELAHAGGGAEGDESNDQSVLDQILALFASREVLDHHIELDHEVIHIDSPQVFGISRPQPVDSLAPVSYAPFQVRDPRIESLGKAESSFLEGKAVSVDLREESSPLR